MIDAWIGGGETDRRLWLERRRQTEESMAESARLRGIATTRRTPEEVDFTQQLLELWQECGTPATERAARHCNLSARTIDSYLEGRTLPTAERLSELLDGLSVLCEADQASPVSSVRESLVGETLLRARTARKEERAKVRQLAKALPGGQPAPSDTTHSNGFGMVAGVLPGQKFDSRGALARAGVHRQLMAGITGRQGLGAESVIVSDNYPGDDDYGDVIVYTGEGGLNPETGRLARDQQLTRGNAALATSAAIGAPVRVIRRITTGSHSWLYQYVGLFKVEDYWSEQSSHGYRVWRFRLVQLTTAEQSESNLSTPVSAVRQEDRHDGDRPGSASSIQRIVRSTATANLVKQMHDYTCQVCGIRILGRDGGYAEAAHIRPLGSPHNGPDVLGNVLCLCPNHHVLFDQGMLIINDDLTVMARADSTVLGRLRETPDHRLDRQHFARHRVLHGLPE
ncbi:MULTISPECIES: YDG/SRA domain-containing protein [unclassified Streptomyces]|uniref:YDG/SRA domain-containing protein n=1 Tax=unclassified Streptomyces TaxID=2593676 RepID=UPI0018E9630A|nr:YDG/SRA domain-containing protein [Streptomyces sp. TSRI0281]